jgi:uncharacterized protein (DUF2249 family)
MTMGQSYLDLDVRPILRDGGEPFSVIMAALARLKPEQGIRLYATFKPIPLFAVMAEKGFSHAETELEGGEWEVLFTPAGTQAPPTSSGAQPTDAWPDPVIRFDSRDLDPPEPMVRILGAAENLKPGETLSALLRREPVFLFPHLEKRGFRWLGGFTADGSTYELTVRAPI